METLPSETSISKPGFVKSVLYSFLEKHLPRRFKRLIYVSSVLGVIQQINNPDEILIDKLNKALELARYPDSIAFPIHIKSMIWKNTDIETVTIINRSQVKICEIGNCDLSAKDYSTIGEYFANHAPSWLKYGAYESMVTDVILLLKQLAVFNSELKKA